MIIDYHLIDFKLVFNREQKATLNDSSYFFFRKRQVIGPRGNECRALIGPNPDVRNVPQCCGMLRNIPSVTSLPADAHAELNVAIVAI